MLTRWLWQLVQSDLSIGQYRKDVFWYVKYMITIRLFTVSSLEQIKRLHHNYESIFGLKCADNVSSLVTPKGRLYMKSCWLNLIYTYQNSSSSSLINESSLGTILNVYVYIFITDVSGVCRIACWFEEAKIDVLHIKVVSSRQFTRGRVVAEYFKDYKGD